LPELKSAEILRHWAGLRPGSPTGIPYICRHTQLSNFYLNCGHFRNGLVTAPASARLITDLILRRTPTLPAENYTMEAAH
jgi:glycine oxidase